MLNGTLLSLNLDRRCASLHRKDYLDGDAANDRDARAAA